MCDSPKPHPSNENDESFDDVPLSPIVGYNFDNDNEELSTSSEEDPEKEEYARTVTAGISLMIEVQPQPSTPRSEKRKRLRKKLHKSRKKAANAELIKRQKLCFDGDTDNLEVKVPEVKNLETEVPEVENLEKEVPEVEHLETEIPEVEHLETEIPEDENLETEVPEVENLETNTTFLVKFDPLNPPGFKTASGKNVSVSRKALDFAGRMFRSIEAADDTPIVKADPPGFKTASKKFIPVSRKAVEKASLLLQGIDEEADVVTAPNKFKPPTRTPGFTSGNGKFVPVSQASLKAVKGLEVNSPTPGKKSNNSGAGEMTQEINDSIMAFLADDEEWSDFS